MTSSYDYLFFNSVNAEGFHLESTIPSNSFQQEDITLAAVAWPAKPAGLSSIVVSGSAVVVEWNYTPGLTYHVYRRVAPSTGSFFRIDDPSGSLSNPGVADSFFVDQTVDGVSTYDYLIIAENGTGELSPHSDVLTVDASVVAAPIVNSITPTSGIDLGGTPVTIVGSGFDIAGAGAIVGTALTGVTVISPYEITGTTAANAAGPADVSVTNLSSAQGSNVLVGGFTFTTNSTPVLALIGPQTVLEGAPLAFQVTASDVDGGFPVLTSSTLPSTATFVDNGDGTADFNWSPTFLESGVYNVTFYATDNVTPALIDSELVVITVTEAGNQLPDMASIGAQAGTEQVPMSFSVSATDAESIPVLTSSALPGTATYVDNGDGTADFNWTPGFTDAGVYNVTFYATDDSAAVDSELVVITINETGNQPPVLDSIGAQLLAEGESLNLIITSSDPDATFPTLTVDTLPEGAAFVDNLDGTANFDWTPGFTQVGSYFITFYADDGIAAPDSEIVNIIVTEAGNQPPVIALIGPQTVIEGDSLGFAVAATDPDSTIPALTTGTLPLGASFLDNGDGTGEFSWIPDFTQDSVYDVMFYADDGSLLDSQLVTITVIEAGNHAPVLDSIGAQLVVASPLPTGATFGDSLDGTGTFTWSPGFDDAGTYDVTFSASDGIAAAVTELVTITVLESGAQAPVIDPIADTSVYEDSTLVMVITATDPEGGDITLSVNTSLSNYTFVDSGNGVGVLTYSPGELDAGTDTVRVFAAEVLPPGLASSALFTITTLDGNRPPMIFTPMAAYPVDVNDSVTFEVWATDTTDFDESHVLYLTALNLPVNATFVDYGNDTGRFVFKPTFGQEGVDTVTFQVVDEGVPSLSATVDVEITVNGINLVPVLDSIGPQALNEGEVLNIALSASDADGVFPTFSTDTLFENMSLVDNGDGTGAFSFTPSFLQAGLYAVTFIADDGFDTDEELVLIQVYEAGNQAPAFDSIPVGLTVVEGTVLIDIVTGSDPELDAVTITAVDSTIPTNFVFVDSGNGVASFEFSPDFTQAGVYTIDLEISDGDQVTQGQLTVEALEAGNQLPVLDTIVDQTIDEAQILSFSVSASDPDGDIPLLSTSPLPGLASFTDNGNGTGSFEWTPTNEESGVYTVTFYATDGVDAGVIDSQDVEITVVDVNRLPNWFINPFQQDTLLENETIVYNLTGWDDDGTVPIIRASLDGQDTLATNMTFSSTVAGSNRDGTLTFSPDYTQGDDNPTFYNVRFYFLDEVDTTFFGSEVVAFRVWDQNEPPFITPQSGPGPFSVAEGDPFVNYIVTAGDNDGTATLAIDQLPDSNFSVTQPTPDAIIFAFTPDFNQSGVYNIRFTATDDDGATTELIVEITVTEVGNQAPFWQTQLGANQPVFATTTFDTTLTAIDPEAGTLTFDVSPAVANAAWVPSATGGTFTFAPDVTQIGQSFLVTFRVTDPVGDFDEFTTSFDVSSFMRGDIDHNEKYTINDVIYMAAYMFRLGPPPVSMEAADVDGSGEIDVSDIAYMVNFLYHSGPRPPQ